MAILLPVDLRQETDFSRSRFLEHAHYMARSLVKPFNQRASALFRAHKFARVSPAAVGFLASDLMKIQAQAIDQASRGEWIGRLFPVVLGHMIREEQFFVRMLQGVHRPVDEIVNAALDASEAALILSKLLDPSEKDLSAIALSFSNAIGAWVPTNFQNYGQIPDRDPAAVRVDAKNLARTISDFVAFASSPRIASAKKILPMDEIEHEGLEAKHHVEMLERIARSSS